MDFIQCSQCSGEVFFYRELAGIDRAAGYLDNGKYVISEWKDTGLYEVTDEWWGCENGHPAKIEMEIEE